MKGPSFGGLSPDTGKDTDMVKSRTLESRIVRKTVAVAAMALLAGAAVQASARGAEPWSVSATPVALLGSSSSSVGHTIFTSRGPAFVTGHLGSMDTVMRPGNGAQGFLSNNGNGSSTLFAPGLPPQTVFTPR
jgi:hypothetical protein